MLTDAALKTLKPKFTKLRPRRHVCSRHAQWRDLVSPGLQAQRSSRDRLSGQVRTARARENCLDARRAIGEGRSPAIEKQREKRRLKEAKSFGEFGEKWLTAAPMADSTRAMRRSIFARELLPVWRNRLLTEITPVDLRVFSDWGH